MNLRFQFYQDKEINGIIKMDLRHRKRNGELELLYLEIGKKLPLIKFIIVLKMIGVIVKFQN